LSQSVNYAEKSAPESDSNVENRIIICALPAIELGNGCGRGRGRERERRPNMPNRHLKRR
jgi:hypothetical protein